MMHARGRGERHRLATVLGTEVSIRGCDSMTTPEENLEMTTSDEWREWAERNAPYARIVGSVIIFNPDMDDPPSPEDG